MLGNLIVDQILSKSLAIVNATRNRPSNCHYFEASPTLFLSPAGGPYFAGDERGLLCSITPAVSSGMKDYESIPAHNIATGTKSFLAIQMHNQQHPSLLTPKSKMHLGSLSTLPLILALFALPLSLAAPTGPHPPAVKVVLTPAVEHEAVEFASKKLVAGGPMKVAGVGKRVE